MLSKCRRLGTSSEVYVVHEEETVDLGCGVSSWGKRKDARRGRFDLG